MKSVPAWSFGSSNRTIGPKTPCSPGPATYESPNKANILKQEQGYSIGRMQRKFNLTANEAPGPGSYTPTRVIRKAPSALMGSGRKARFQTPSPGPAEYSATVAKRNDFGFSFRPRGRTTPSKNKTSPSPADY